MIYIVLVTVMLATELFYLTTLFSFTGCCFEFLPLFTPCRFAVYQNYKGVIGVFDIDKRVDI